MRLLMDGDPSASRGDVADWLASSAAGAVAEGCVPVALLDASALLYCGGVIGMQPGLAQAEGLQMTLAMYLSNVESGLVLVRTAARAPLLSGGPPPPPPLSPHLRAPALTHTRGPHPTRCCTSAARRPTRLPRRSPTTRLSASHRPTPNARRGSRASRAPRPTARAPPTSRPWASEFGRRLGAANNCDCIMCGRDQLLPASESVCFGHPGGGRGLLLRVAARALGTRSLARGAPRWKGPGVEILHEWSPGVENDVGAMWVRRELDDRSSRLYAARVKVARLAGLPDDAPVRLIGVANDDDWLGAARATAPLGACGKAGAQRAGGRVQRAASAL